MMEEIIVNVKNGQVKGKVCEDYKGEKFYSFQGIPYAKPPIGALRFKAPQPAEPWGGVWDATKEGNVCYQLDVIFSNSIIGSEDCLFVNVYTKALGLKALKPVMVFVHGGGFYMGSGNTVFYGPEFLITEDVVLVTFNYRLGILGFLSFDEPALGVAGNAGLKDQILALKWVQENISHFSGDPGNVTVFGESAGAASVHYLVLTPATKGLFSRAILQSGSALNPWARGKPLEVGTLADFGIVAGDPAGSIVAKLQSMPVEEVFDIQLKTAKSLDPANVNYYCPVAENAETVDAVWTEHPLDIIRSGQYNDVPLIFGYTADEGIIVHGFKQDPRSDFCTSLEYAILHSFNVRPGTDESRLMADRIETFYLKDKHFTAGNVHINDLIELGTDTMFLIGIMDAVKAHVATTKAQVYLYKMTVETKLNMMQKLFLKLEKSYGICHGDDLGYLFKNRETPEIEVNSAEQKALEKFLRLWSNFAKHGNPTPDRSDGVLNVDWRPVEKGLINFLQLGHELRMSCNPEQKRMEFWSEISKWMSLKQVN